MFGRDLMVPAPAGPRREAGFAVPGRDSASDLAAVVTAPDSLVAVLPAGADGPTLVLRGTIQEHTAHGTWSYTGRSLPTWRGTFVLRRRRRAVTGRVPEHVGPGR